MNTEKQIINILLDDILDFISNLLIDIEWKAVSMI